MSSDQNNTRCPHCGSETGIQRGAPAGLPVTPTLAEFETLVRNEWRRRLGPKAYARSHSGKVIRDLATFLAENGEDLSLEQIEDGVEQVMVDLRVEGKGRQALWHEIAKLRHAVRAVLRNAGADFVTASDYVGRARGALDETLDSLSLR